MRKREEITPAVNIIETRDEVLFNISPFEQIQLEVLLDIRDLLAESEFDKRKRFNTPPHHEK